jgi:putative redox protein
VFLNSQRGNTLSQQIQFTNHRGEKLAGTLHVPWRDFHRGIILGHCFTCSRHTRVLRQISEGLVSAGFNVLRFDFSGNGQSEGEFSASSYSKQIAEMKTAASYMDARGVSWLGLAGHSMGAMVALLAAAEMDSIKALCVLAARSSGPTVTDFLSESQLDELRLTGRVSLMSRGRSLELTQEFFDDTARHDLPAVVASLRQHIFVVHGDQDEIIPVDEAYRLQQLQPKSTQLAIVSGADHMFSREEHRQQVSELVVTWFERQATEDTG